jgi:hypothetical protein
VCVERQRGHHDRDDDQGQLRGEEAFLGVAARRYAAEANTS